VGTESDGTPLQVRNRELLDEREFAERIALDELNARGRAQVGFRGIASKWVDSERRSAEVYWILAALPTTPRH